MANQNKKKSPTPLWMRKVWKSLPWVIIGGLLITLYLGGIFAQLTGGIFSGADFSFGILHCILANFRYGFYGFFMMLLLYGCLVVWIYLRYKDKHRRDLESDERGFDTDNSGTYGTASLLGIEETREYVEVEPLEKTKGFILGKFVTEGSDGTDKVISVPPDGKRYAYDAIGRPIMEVNKAGQKVHKREKLSFNGNRHVMVLGPSGSGKSYSYSRPNIYQSILQGESVVVTDPKGELYAGTSEFAKEHGYVVRIFNLAWPNGSDALDFLGEVRGDQIGIEAQDFASIVIENTENPNSKGDAAYTNGEKNLLQALVLFVLTAPNCPYPKTMGGVYQLLCESLDSLETRFSMLPPNNPALGPWSIFKDGSEAFKGNLRTGLGNRLTVLNDEIIKNITGNKEIDLELPGKTKCIYYVIMSDMKNTFKFLSSLFFTYLFNRLVEYSRKQITGKLPVSVNVIMDEFIAIGQLPGFAEKLATVRSAGISISIIFQNKPQLDAAYPDGVSDGIIGNCSTILCLACNDLVTAKFLSDRSGITTVALDQMRIERPVVQLGAVPSTISHTYSLNKRAVFNLDEIMRLDPSKVLITITSANQFLADKFPYTDIVSDDDIHVVNMYDHVPAWREKLSYKRQDETQQQDNGYKPETTQAQSIIPQNNTTPSTEQQAQPTEKPEQKPDAKRPVEQKQTSAPRPPASPPVKGPEGDPSLYEEDDDLCDADEIENATTPEDEPEAPPPEAKPKRSRSCIVDEQSKSAISGF